MHVLMNGTEAHYACVNGMEPGFTSACWGCGGVVQDTTMTCCGSGWGELWLLVV